MSIIHDNVMGKILIPEFSRVRFLPGQTTGRGPGPIGIFRFVVRSGEERNEGAVTQAGFGVNGANIEGLRKRWREDEEINRAYRTPEEFVASFGKKLKWAADNPAAYRQYTYAHNGRVANGGIMTEYLLYGVSSVDQAIHGPPTYVALAKSFTITDSDLSIGSATHNVTTNEWAADGLTRAAETTLTHTDPTGSGSSTDLTYTVVVGKTFSMTGTGPDSVYGAALFDNTSGTGNLYCEATATTASLNTGDTFAATWTNQG